MRRAVAFGLHHSGRENRFMTRYYLATGALAVGTLLCMGSQPAARAQDANRAEVYSKTDVGDVVAKNG